MNMDYAAGKDPEESSLRVFPQSSVTFALAVQEGGIGRSVEGEADS
jgi:hypothetical protein